MPGGALSIPKCDEHQGSSHAEGGEGHKNLRCGLMSLQLLHKIAPPIGYEEDDHAAIVRLGWASVNGGGA